MKTEREYRDMTMVIVPEIREDEEQEGRMMVRGYATTFNEPYTLYEDKDFRFDEVVSETAFTDTDMSDVIMQYNHEGRVFARTRNNTLTVTPDEKGLLIEADLGGTELGRQLYEEIKGGYTDRMSFGFTVDGEDRLEEEDPAGNVKITRTITSIRKLYDVSAVSIPANDATSISVRNLTDGEITRIQTERSEREELELMRKRAQLKARILGGIKNDD